MAAVVDRSAAGARVQPMHSAPLHPLHLVLLAGTVPLFLGALLCDIAYTRTYHIQWSNFASWLIVGGLVFGAAVVVFALAGLASPRRRHRGHLVYVLLVLSAWVAGLFNALVHAKDAWAAMPEGLVLSVVVLVLSCAATALGFSTRGATHVEERA